MVDRRDEAEWQNDGTDGCRVVQKQWRDWQRLRERERGGVIESRKDKGEEKSIPI